MPSGDIGLCTTNLKQKKTYINIHRLNYKCSHRPVSTLLSVITFNSTSVERIFPMSSGSPWKVLKTHIQLNAQ